MFCFKLDDGNEYQVHFKHSKQEELVPVVVKGEATGETKLVHHPFKTECSITAMSPDDMKEAIRRKEAAKTSTKKDKNLEILGKLIGFGSAVVSDKDQFDYDRGRKLTLKRAILGSSIPKIDRIKIWREYFTATNNLGLVFELQSKTQ